MAEALEDLQDSTSRLEAENRTLKMGASPKGRGSASGRGSEQVRDVRLVVYLKAKLLVEWQPRTTGVNSLFK